MTNQIKKSVSKVKLKDLPFNKELHDKTLQYWKLMRCWNGIDTTHDKKPLTVSKAFDIIRKIQAELNPHRPLNIGLNTLKESIVEHGSKASNKNQVPANASVARITIL